MESPTVVSQSQNSDGPTHRHDAARFLSLPHIWAYSLFLFSLLMTFTIFIPPSQSTMLKDIDEASKSRDLFFATMVIALCGVPWGVMQWVPFTLVAELVSSDVEEGNLQTYEYDDVGGTDQLLSGSSRNHNSEPSTTTTLSAGTILGIHNTSIVIPQFVSTLITGIVFWFMARDDDNALGNSGTGDAFGVCLRLGSVFTFGAAILALKIL